MTKDQREFHRKKRILEYAERIGNINKACRYFGIARSSFYEWRDRYREFGDEGLKSRKCCPHNHPNKTSDEVVEKILHLHGKVERSHRTDKDEFYQLLTYRDDVDLEKKLAVWEHFYNFDRPHGAHSGKTPYEALREKLS